MFVRYSMDAGQISPEKYHFLPAHLLQNPCLDNFKIKFQFPVGWETFLLSSTGKKKNNKKPKKTLLLYIFRNLHFQKFPTK